MNIYLTYLDGISSENISQARVPFQSGVNGTYTIWGSKLLHKVSENRVSTKGYIANLMEGRKKKLRFLIRVTVSKSKKKYNALMWRNVSNRLRANDKK